MAPGEIPPQLWWFISVALTLGIAPVTDARGLPVHALGLVLACAANLLLGAALAYGTRVLYGAAMLAGQMSGVIAGVSAAEAVSPQAVPVPAVGNLYTIGALALLYGSGGIGTVLLSLHNSMAVWPLGDPAAGLAQVTSGGAVAVLVQMFGLAIGIAGPVVGAEMAVMAVMGFVGRAMPQLNLLTAGLPVQLLVFGFLLLVLSGPLAAALAALGVRVAHAAAVVA